MRHFAFLLFAAFLFFFLAISPLSSPALGQDTQLQFADGLYREGMFELAAKEYTKILADRRRHPQASEIRLRLGDALIQLGRHEEAVAVLREIVKRDPRFD